ncbi:hypothetical protein C8J56DRAFT_948386 [Mycena floridula]|nr:hypothetical protein C8J56DRAFT_948386 [Mycena floridula]
MARLLRIFIFITSSCVFCLGFPLCFRLDPLSGSFGFGFVFVWFCLWFRQGWLLCNFFGLSLHLLVFFVFLFLCILSPWMSLP